MTHFLTKGRAVPAALALSALLLTGACGKKKVDELPPAPGYGEGGGVGMSEDAKHAALLVELVVVEWRHRGVAPRMVSQRAGL